MRDEQRLILLIASIPFGLVIGSFLNVVIFRLPRECMSLAKGRSRCSECLKMIAWYDNIPIFSFINLGGRCRHCGTPFSIRYPIIEGLTGLAFYFVSYYCLFYKWGTYPSMTHFGAEYIFSLYLVSVFIAMTAIDFEFFILPEQLTYSGIAIGFIYTSFFIDPSKTEVFRRYVDDNFVAALLYSGAGAALGGLIPYLLQVIGNAILEWWKKNVQKVKYDETMGTGDVFLMAMVGAMLGPKDCIIAFMLAAVFGSIYGLPYKAIKKTSLMPFGPFICLGCLTMWFFSNEIYKLYRMLLTGYHQ